jgi:hypothetical protein
MTTYTAYFYTDGAYASTEIEASNPQEALEKAKGRYELEEGDDLIFSHYDEGFWTPTATNLRIGTMPTCTCASSRRICSTS